MTISSINWHQFWKVCLIGSDPTYPSGDFIFWKLSFEFTQMIVEYQVNSAYVSNGYYSINSRTQKQFCLMKWKHANFKQLSLMRPVDIHFLRRRSSLMEEIILRLLLIIRAWRWNNVIFGQDYYQQIGFRKLHSHAINLWYK